VLVSEGDRILKTVYTRSRFANLFTGVTNVECTILRTANNSKCPSVMAVSRSQKVVNLTLTSWCILTD